MSKIRKNITETIGNTPLVELQNITDGLKARVIVKIESFNPMGSAKDRIAKSMIEDAEKKGLLKEGATIIEPTSGNTGIGLAFISASRGYKLILTMPDTMSIERMKLLKALGAEIVLTPGSKGMTGAIEKAEEICRETPGAFVPQQFKNSANPEAHRKSTALEIWDDTDGEVDIFVAGVGTGGTLTGVGEILKSKKESVKIVAVEPEDSAVLSGEEPGPHKIQGIGAGFIPDILNASIIDEIIKVQSEKAGETTRALARREGILAGISSGAALAAGIELAGREENEGKTIVVLLPDSGERYLSTWLFDE